MSAPRTIRKAAPLFAALGDETRLRLLQRLARGGPQSIAELTEAAEVSRQAVTKHLEVLARAGLVQGERSGREHVWRMEPARMDDARAYIDGLARQWDDALERLRQFVEE